MHTIPNQYKAAHTLHTKPQKNLLYRVTVKKKKTKNKLCCILSSVAVWPQHLIHIPTNDFPGQALGEISPSMVIPAMKIYLHVRRPCLGEEVYTLVDFGHTLSFSRQKKKTQKD